MKATATDHFEDPRFLNIDLEVRSRRSLGDLVAAWPWCYQPLVENGRADSRWLVLNPRSARNPTAEAAARELLQHIEKLGGGARQCWKHAHRRTFDIGIRAGVSGPAFEEVRLTTETLRRIAAVGASIQVTVYPPQPIDQSKRIDR